MHAPLFRLIAVLALVLTAFPASAFTRVQYFCRMMGTVTPSCCCGSETEQHELPPAAELRAPDCCERLNAADPLTPQGTRAAVPDVPPQALLATVIRLPLLVDTRASSLAQRPACARAPPAFGPALFLKHRALLT